MKKHKKVLLIILSSILALGIIGGIGVYIAYEKAGDYLLEQMLESQLTNTLLDEIGIDIKETGRELTQEEIDKFKQSSITSAGDIDTIEKNKKVESNKGVASKGESSVQGKNETSTSQTTPPSKPITTDDLRQVLERKVQEVTKVVPSTDKRAMTNLVVSHLAMSDIQYLAKLVVDGVSREDLVEAKKIALKSFDKEELEQVRVYYDKYKHLIP